MNKIKVVGTLGSLDKDEEVIQNLIVNGVDAIKIDMNLFSREEVRSIIDLIRMLNKKLDTNVGTMLSIGGPSIHLGRLQGEKAYFESGDKIRLYVTDLIGNDTKASVDYKDLLDEVVKGDYITLNKGNVKLRVYDKGSEYLICDVIKSGNIVSFSDVNIISDSKIFLRIRDVKDIEFADEVNVDFIELPKVKSSDDVMQVTDMLIGLKNDHISVIAKIDNENALEDIDSIVKIADGVLIDRNSLSLELPMERIPGIQKLIINKCRRIGKISIVSTDIPINSSDIPTRIEVQDLANAVLDGVDAISLDEQVELKSSYINKIRKIESILSEVETSIDYTNMFEDASREENIDVTGMIATNVAATANKLNCKAIIIPTITGYTARKISRFRPCCPIIAVSSSIDTVTSLSLHFGVNAVLIDDLNSLDKIIKISENITRGLIPIEKGDKIIITGGYPFKESKSTNFMKIEEI